MIDYSDLSDEALDAKIAELGQKVENLATGGGVEVVAGEGRRMEFTRSSRGDLLALYRSAVEERRKRRGDAPLQTGIRVNFP